MLILKIQGHTNGAHDNQESSQLFSVPEGWAVVPEDLGTMDTLENFPFGDIAVEVRDGVPTVTRWMPLPVPEPEEPPEPVEPPTSLAARVDALETETAAITAAIERGLAL